ncbi:MAG: protein kinase [Vicinamibacteria bacterium]
MPHLPDLICPSCQAENSAGADACFTCGRALGALTQGSLIAGRYEVQGVVGKGGMGMVYRAHDRMLDEVVAIKVLRGELAATPAMAERFRSEIKLARRVSHPNVCRIHDYGEDAGTSFISMELLEGQDLKQCLAHSPDGLPPAEAYSAALQLAKGLQAIHEMGIIHRDLKTPNAMRDPSGVVRLMDFGIAKGEGQGHTATGEVMGTPEYMSPEQCRGEKLDARSDIYTLGVVIYELFTGQVPFRGENMMATLFKQIGEPVPFDGPPGARVPRSLVPVLQKALAKERGQRYQAVGELYAAIKEAQRHADAEPPAVAAPPAAAAPIATPPVVTPQPRLADAPDRRAQNRLEIHVNVFLCRLDSTGGILHQERTVADNLSRHGARVMTSVPDLAPGDEVMLKEAGGDFEARAVVRHAYVGPDHIPRVGLQFVDRTAPDRLVLTDGERVETLRPGSGRAASGPPPGATPRRVPATPLPSTPGSVPVGGAERRRDTRLPISVDISLRRLRADGSIEKEERTVADNVSRGGARVLTSMTDVKPGERISLREIGGDFETEAVVRNSFVGPDRIPRLGVEFVGRTAPDRLVPESETTRRARRVPTTKPPTVGRQARQDEPASAAAAEPAAVGAASAAGALEERRMQLLEAYRSITTRNHFEFLEIDRGAREADVKEAYLRLAKRYHPDAARDPALADLERELSAIFVRLGEAYDVLRDPEKRGRYESRLGPRKASERMKPPSAAQGTPVAAVEAHGAEQPAPRPAPESEEQRNLRVETAIRTARRHFAAQEHWEVVQLLEPLLDEPVTSRLRVALLLLMAQAMAKNPKWLKRSEELVVSALHEDPTNVEAHHFLGMLYKQAGLVARARTAFRKALELQPGHAGAAAELDALEGPSNEKRR